MKRVILLALLLGLLLVPAAFAADENIVWEPAFMPMSPTIMAQGGSFSAIANGWNSLFSNPAGYAAGTFNLNIVSFNPWLFMRPDQLMNGIRVFADPSAIVSELSTGDLLQQFQTAATETGLGFGASAGIGLVGGGFAIAAVGIVDAYFFGDTFPFGMEGDLNATVGLIGGIAIPFEFLGIRLRVGADLRPMLRIRAALDSSIAGSMLNAMMGGSPDAAMDPMALLNMAGVSRGFGVGIDFGAIAEFGPFSASLSVRDFLNTRFIYSASTVEQTLTDLGDGNWGVLFPVDGTQEGDTSYMIPMNAILGFGFHPDLGGLSGIIDPRVHVEIQDLIRVFRGELSPWLMIHIGAEAQLLAHIFRVRAGLNQGYATVGAGVNFLGIELNAALFTREMGRYPGDLPSSGVSVEVAFRPEFRRRSAEQ